LKNWKNIKNIKKLKKEKEKEEEPPSWLVWGGRTIPLNKNNFSTVLTLGGTTLRATRWFGHSMAEYIYIYIYKIKGFGPWGWPNHPRGTGPLNFFFFLFFFAMRWPNPWKLDWCTNLVFFLKLKYHLWCELKH